MLHATQAPPKRRRKALPALSAAGLSLVLASTASAGALGGQNADLPTQGIGVSQQMNPSEEEFSDVSLATFYVFDNEGAATARRGVRLAVGGCGGCAGCAGCSGGSSSDYQAPTTWNNAGALSVNPPRKAVRTPKRKSGQRRP